jgi:hypothetical protein
LTTTFKLVLPTEPWYSWHTQLIFYTAYFLIHWNNLSFPFLRNFVEVNLKEKYYRYIFGVGFKYSYGITQVSIFSGWLCPINRLPWMSVQTNKKYILVSFLFLGLLADFPMSPVEQKHCRTQHLTHHFSGCTLIK